MRPYRSVHWLGPLLCARHAPPLCVADDGWRFTSVRTDDLPQSEPLPVLVEPFAPPLWVGETRKLFTLDGERFELLRSTAGAPFAHMSGSQSFGGPVNSRRYTGALATQTLCSSLGPDGAQLIGLRRLRVESVASTRPTLRARCRLLPDVVSEPSEAKRRAVELWHTASELSRTVRQRKLEQKLASLGGPAAQLMLSISTADQAEMLRRGGRSAETGRVARTRSPREYLDAGGTFAKEAERVRELLLTAGGDASLVPAAGWFESFIALRWASGGSEQAHAVSCGLQRSVSDDARSLGNSGAWSEEFVFEPCDELRRWAEVARLTAAGLAALRAEASLLSLGGSGNAGGESGG